MTLDDDYRENAVRTLEPAKGLKSARTQTCGRVIRAYIGGPLRSYFAAKQQMPFPAELSDLIEQLSQETTDLDQELE
jgi:hypothetical protein